MGADGGGGIHNNATTPAASAAAAAAAAHTVCRSCMSQERPHGVGVCCVRQPRRVLEVAGEVGEALTRRSAHLSQRGMPPHEIAYTNTQCATRLGVPEEKRARSHAPGPQAHPRQLPPRRRQRPCRDLLLRQPPRAQHRHSRAPRRSPAGAPHAPARNSRASMTKTISCVGTTETINRHDVLTHACTRNVTSTHKYTHTHRNKHLAA
jgi:hypothetical protein